MPFHFYKYQATGNDFVLMDNRQGKYSFTIEQIKQICDRRFGVGADGLILLEKDDQSDFKMVYFNSDGTQSLCGNGCRSAVDFASYLKIINSKTTFNAYDGLHQANILGNKLVRLKMSDVTQVKSFGEDLFINTGSPHYIQFVSNLSGIEVVNEGRKIRYSDDFKPAGTNVNFVELLPNNSIAVRTYERGVENETLSCGTGVTAAALAASLKGYTSPVSVQVSGGFLTVEFKSESLSTNLTADKAKSDRFSDIFLIGPAKMVFEGDLEL